ncbi:hypothetical protein FHY04_004077 [Sphingomonas sp. BK481]|nr:hypothetical protein [Sphingomonas sp. BK481]
MGLCCQWAVDRAWTQGRGGPGPYTQGVSGEDLRSVFFEAQIDFQGLGF